MLCVRKYARLKPSLGRMPKRSNPHHVAEKEARKKKRTYAESNKRDEDEGTYHLTEYFFENGLRKVKPYFFNFKSFVKGRWVGKEILEVFKTEFRGESESLLQKRFDSGRILVNGESVTTNYILRDNDFMSNSVHRHEQPVKDEPIEVIHEDEQYYVVNKPASIPVHPAGRFRYNSLLFIIGKELKRKDVSACHRLDRLTSGVQIMGKTCTARQKAFHLLKSHQVMKAYIAGVKGQFPPNEVKCEAPIGSLCQRIGIFRVCHKTGSESVTNFKLLHYDPERDLSFIQCVPLTGRTHQIRVHLQYLGYPIVNDPLYNTVAWGPEKGKEGISPEDPDELELVTRRLREEHEGTAGMAWRQKAKFMKKKPDVSCCEHESESKACDLTDSSFDPICEECGFEFEDPPLDELEIYLHSFRYSIDGLFFEAPLPHWAKPFEQIITDECLSFDNGTERSSNSLENGDETKLDHTFEKKI